MRKWIFAVVPLFLALALGILALRYWATIESPSVVRVIGPNGLEIDASLPNLAALPFDLTTACAEAKSYTSDAATLNGFPDDLSGCEQDGPKSVDFYRTLGALLYNRHIGLSAVNATHAISSLREALHRAQSAAEVAELLDLIGTRAAGLAETSGRPELFSVAAEVMGLRATYCIDGNHDCRVAALWAQANDLSDAGRWKGDPALLLAAIAVYRRGIDGTDERSPKWVSLQTGLGSALAQLSESQTDRTAKRNFLQEALDIYEAVSNVVPSSAASSWAMIQQNMCSIREPLAGVDRDRNTLKKAIEECKAAATYYASHNQGENEAAAHHNLGRAYGRLVEWDKDDIAATQAIDEWRKAAALYQSAGQNLSFALSQTNLAEALLDKRELLVQKGGASQLAIAHLYYQEAKTKLDAAESVLTEAKSKKYLAIVARVRERLDAVPRG